MEKKPNYLTVIEKDEKLAEILNNKFKNNIKIINGDILKVDINDYLNNKNKYYIWKSSIQHFNKNFDQLDKKR